MKRKAIIIFSGDDLPGAKADADHLHTFLLSARGGAWTPQEIVVLKEPSVAMVDAHLKLAALADYSFVSFGGHGRYNVTKKTTEVQLSKNVLIDAATLRLGAKRHTLVVDACRVLHGTSLNETLLAKAAMESIELSESNSREIFDSHLRSCPQGLVELYSCDISETAGEEASGGYYSSALLAVAEQWGKTAPRSSVFSIKDAHDAATPLVRRKSGTRQNPQAGYPRSQPYFPFAIKGA